MTHQIASFFTGTNAFVGGQIKKQVPLRRPTEADANRLLTPQVDNIIERVLESPSIAVAGVSTVVGYNADSKDAMFATAMFISALGARNDIVALPFTDEIPYDRLATFPQVVLIGAGEIDQDFLDKMRYNKGRVTLFTYRQTLNDDALFAVPADKKNWRGVKTKIEPQWEGRLNVVRPITSGDQFSDYGELERICSNTLIDLMHIYLETISMPLHAPALTGMLAAAKRYVSMAAPITNSPTVGLNELIYTVEDVTDVATGKVRKVKKIDLEHERNTKAALFNLFPKIATALRAFHRASALRALTLNDDTDAYMQYWKENSETYARSAVNTTYKLKNTKGLGIVLPGSKDSVKASQNAARSKFSVIIATMACNESRHHEMLSVALTHGKSFVSYEDMHGVRLWRVYAKDMSLRNAIACSMGGEKVWDDGLCLRTYTRLSK